MVTETPAPAAPAPPEPNISATREAANRGDFSAFDKAESAARAGKPLPDVPAPAAAAAAADPDDDSAPAAAADGQPAKPTLSRREREQQDTNERIRTAVDRATADTRAELARLQAQIDARAPRQEPAAPTTQAEYKRLMALPNAPKLEHFSDSDNPLEDHAAAMALFIADTRYEERETARAQQDRQRNAQTSEHARLTQFDEKIAVAKTADAAFLERTRPIAAQLVPVADVQAINRAEKDPTRRMPIGPLNTLADEVIDSAHTAAILDHFAAHPEDFEAFKTLTSPRDVTRAFGRLEARLKTSDAAPVAPAPKKLISDAPPPPPIISTPQASTDPKTAAIAKGDFAAFDRIEMQEKRQRRAGA